MDKRILELIEYAIKDGVITAKERSAIHDVADEKGYLPEEVDLIMDARLAEIQQIKASPKKQKLGQCPACGAMVNSGQLQCQDCGYEFRGIGPNTFVKEFQDKLEYTLSKEYSNKAKAKAEAQLVKNYPLPMTKEDSIEMLNYLRTSIQPSNKNARHYLNYYKAILQRAKTLGRGDQTIQNLTIEFEETAQKANKRILVASVVRYSITLLIIAFAVVIFQPKASNSEEKCRRVVTRLIASNELERAKNVLYEFNHRASWIDDVYCALIEAAIKSGDGQMAKEVTDHYVSIESIDRDNVVPYIFNHLISQGEYDEAEHYLRSSSPRGYYDFLKKCVEDMCNKQQYAEARRFITRKATFFQENYADDPSYKEYNRAKSVQRLNTIIKSYTD